MSRPVAAKRLSELILQVLSGRWTRFSRASDKVAETGALP